MASYASRGTACSHRFPPMPPSPAGPSPRLSYVSSSWVPSRSTASRRSRAACGGRGWSTLPSATTRRSWRPPGGPVRPWSARTRPRMPPMPVPRRRPSHRRRMTTLRGRRQEDPSIEVRPPLRTPPLASGTSSASAAAAPPSGTILRRPRSTPSRSDQ